MMFFMSWGPSKYVICFYLHVNLYQQKQAEGQISVLLIVFLSPHFAVLSYLMLVKDTLGSLSGMPGHQCLIVSSLAVILPLSLQRDVADLAKTSRISVMFNIALVGIIATFSPSPESIEQAGGFSNILSQSTFRPGTCFIGLGIISFAFSCQHSSLIIAGSLENPTRERWTKVSSAALAFVSILAVLIGTFGYLGFLESTNANILVNFPMPFEVDTAKELVAAKAANVGRGLICCTLCFVYPLESFVARHVIMTNLFQGRDAHEGDDHAVLDRWDRRVATTIVLYLSVLIPALKFDDVGTVLAWSGTVAATSLTYLGPGLLFIGVHGDEFLDLVESKWTNYDNPGLLNRILWAISLMPVWCKVASLGKCIYSYVQMIIQNFMPIKNAATANRCTGSRGLSLYYTKKESMTPADEYRLGKVKHRRELLIKQKQRRSRNDLLEEEETKSFSSKTSTELGLIMTSTSTPESTKKYGSVTNINDIRGDNGMNWQVDCGEEDPQDEKQTIGDFAVAIGFVLFGVLAFTAGIYSIYTSG